jgi:hypothetical protein
LKIGSNLTYSFNFAVKKQADAAEKSNLRKVERKHAAMTASRSLLESEHGGCSRNGVPP